MKCSHMTSILEKHLFKQFTKKKKTHYKTLQHLRNNRLQQRLDVDIFNHTSNVNKIGDKRVREFIFGLHVTLRRSRCAEGGGCVRVTGQSENLGTQHVMIF